MPTTQSRHLKHALFFALHALNRDDPAPNRVVHLSGADGVMSVAAAGSRGCALAQLEMRGAADPWAFTIAQHEAENLHDFLASVNTVEVSAGRDNFTADDGMRNPHRCRRVRVPLVDFSAWFETTGYPQHDGVFEFPAHLIGPAVTALTRITGPHIHIRLGLGASPFLVEASRPHLGGLLSAKFSIFPTLKA